MEPFIEPSPDLSPSLDFYYSLPSSISIYLCFLSDYWRVSIFKNSLGLEKSFCDYCLTVLALSLKTPTSPFRMPLRRLVRGLLKL